MVVHTVDRRNRDQDPDPLAGHMKKRSSLEDVYLRTIVPKFEVDYL